MADSGLFDDLDKALLAAMVLLMLISMVLLAYQDDR